MKVFEPSGIGCNDASEQPDLYATAPPIPRVARNSATRSATKTAIRPKRRRRELRLRRRARWRRACRTISRSRSLDVRRPAGLRDGLTPGSSERAGRAEPTMRAQPQLALEPLGVSLRGSALANRDHGVLAEGGDVHVAARLRAQRVDDLVEVLLKR